MCLLRDLKNRSTSLLTFATIFYKWRRIIDSWASYNVSSTDQVAESLNQLLYGTD